MAAILIKYNFKNINLHLSQNQLEIERKERNFGIILINVNDHSITFLNIWKISISIFFKFKKPHKLALISETVRDRAKRTEFGDHMD